MPLYLGVKAVAVKSFARIHKANLINSGILPLVFADPTDYDDIEQGDVLVFTQRPQGNCLRLRRDDAEQDEKTAPTGCPANALRASAKCCCTAA